VIAVIDNYDSFTYNLVQMLGEMGTEPLVFRNDVLSAEELEKLKPRAIIISPGPGRPEEAGITLQVIKYFAGQIPVFGVCLGHQAIGQCFGAVVVRAPVPVHGKTSAIYHNSDPIFAGLNNPFQATRYHSLVIERESLPECLHLIAESEEGLVMAVRHKKLPLLGVQFHPESLITTGGAVILKNFLREEKA